MCPCHRFQPFFKNFLEYIAEYSLFSYAYLCTSINIRNKIFIDEVSYIYIYFLNHILLI